MPQAQQNILNRYGKTAVIGAGVIGASWTALFLAHGLEVVVNDPRPDVEALVRDYIRNNLSTLEALGLPTANLEAKLRFEADLERAVAGAHLVQENGPERIEFKQDLWGTHQQGGWRQGAAAVVEFSQDRDGTGAEVLAARAAAGRPPL